LAILRQALIAPEFLVGALHGQALSQQLWIVEIGRVRVYSP
jgi:hypothetical protein